jgi:methionyl-tRNA formyltransferase
MNIKIAFFGNSKFSVFCLEEMKKRECTPALIVTTPDRHNGRKMQLNKSETKVWAETNCIPFIEQEKLKEECFLNKLKDYDLFLVASYGKIIPNIILDMAKYGILNIHPSLLPKYRGPSPLQEQILDDDLSTKSEKKIGVTLMLMDQEIDHGPIIAQEKINIPNWPVNLIRLKEITAKVGVKLFIDNLGAWINNNIKPKKQDHSKATFTKKIEKEDGQLDIVNGDNYKNYLKYLAYYGWPQTYFFIKKNNQKIRIIIKEAEFTDNKFIIKKVLPEGKKEMSYEDFLRGLK